MAVNISHISKPDTDYYYQSQPPEILDVLRKLVAGEKLSPEQLDRDIKWAIDNPGLAPISAEQVELLKDWYPRFNKTWLTSLHREVYLRPVRHQESMFAPMPRPVI